MLAANEWQYRTAISSLLSSRCCLIESLMLEYRSSQRTGRHVLQDVLVYKPNVWHDGILLPLGAVQRSMRLGQVTGAFSIRS